MPAVRLATFLPAGESDPIAGEVRGDEIVAFANGTVRDRLANGDRSAADGPVHKLADVTLLAPVPKPRAIFGIGLNYAAHAAEGGSEPPEQPIVFMKVPTAVVPPGGPVVCPKVVRRLDYEGELVVVLGSGGQIAGYAIADDVSARDLQRREPPGSSPATPSRPPSRTATCSGASRSGRAPRAPTRSARGARGSPRLTRWPT